MSYTYAPGLGADEQATIQHPPSSTPATGKTFVPSSGLVFGQQPLVSHAVPATVDTVETGVEDTEPPPWHEIHRTWLIAAAAAAGIGTMAYAIFFRRRVAMHLPVPVSPDSPSGLAENAEPGKWTRLAWRKAKAERKMKRKKKGKYVRAPGYWSTRDGKRVWIKGYKRVPLSKKNPSGVEVSSELQLDADGEVEYERVYVGPEDNKHMVGRLYQSRNHPSGWMAYTKMGMVPRYGSRRNLISWLVKKA